MQTVELAEAKSRLSELVESLVPGDEIIIEKNHQPVARLLPTDSSRRPREVKAATRDLSDRLAALADEGFAFEPLRQKKVPPCRF